MIPRLQHKEQVQIRHIKGLEENNKELRAEVEQLGKQLTEVRTAQGNMLEAARKTMKVTDA